MIDLRSDTVTRPTPEMREAMAHAEVHDDVIDVDPTVVELQDRVAEMLGKPAALYMPSGTMTNQIAIRLHCGRGEEFICDADAHVFHYEQAAFAQLSGVAVRPVQGQQGTLRVEQLHGLVRAENDHLVRTRLVVIENTHNRGGGRIQPFDDVNAICEWAHGEGLRTHMDGARLWNAAIATGISERQWAEPFDSVSVCMSKGLGAPIGSVLAGEHAFIREARRARKLFGGGMRQVGMIAAGALFALQHHRSRLDEDHQAAQRLGAVVRENEFFELLGAQVDTNIVIFHVDPQLGSSEEVVQYLADHEIQCSAISPQSVRMVTHLGVSSSDISHVCEVLREVSPASIAGHRERVRSTIS